MLKKSLVLSILITGSFVLPSHAQGILGSILGQLVPSQNQFNTSNYLPTGVPANTDPSSYVPFQTTTVPLSDPLNPASGATQITARYLNTADPNLSNTSSGMRNGLPPTRMDSFVYNAGELADQIYGDEGIVDLPPIQGFNPINRINAGIFDRTNTGLTTGHGSYLPTAWGYDEFEPQQTNGYDPWTISGTNLPQQGISLPGLGTLNVGTQGVSLTTNSGATVGYGQTGLTTNVNSLLGSSTANHGTTDTSAIDGGGPGPNLNTGF